MCKEESLYNEGLKPLLYSTEDARTRSVGWRRCGDNIAYYRNNDSSWVMENFELWVSQLKIVHKSLQERRGEGETHVNVQYLISSRSGHRLLGALLSVHVHRSSGTQIAFAILQIIVHKSWATFISHSRTLLRSTLTFLWHTRKQDVQLNKNSRSNCRAECVPTVVKNIIVRILFAEFISHSASCFSITIIILSVNDSQRPIVFVASRRLNLYL